MAGVLPLVQPTTDHISVMRLAAIENRDRNAAIVCSRSAKGRGFAVAFDVQTIDVDALQAEGFTHHLGT